MKTVEEEWEQYRREVIPPHAPPGQLRECRMAFYAGASALFGLVVDASGSDADNHEPTREELGRLEAICREIQNAKFPKVT